MLNQGQMEETLELFKGIGLSETKARETAKNAAVSSTLTSLILQVQVGWLSTFSLYYSVVRLGESCNLKSGRLVCECTQYLGRAYRTVGVAMSLTMW